MKRFQAPRRKRGTGGEWRRIVSVSGRTCTCTCTCACTCIIHVCKAVCREGGKLGTRDGSIARRARAGAGGPNTECPSRHRTARHRAAHLVTSRHISSMISSHLRGPASVARSRGQSFINQPAGCARAPDRRCGTLSRTSLRLTQHSFTRKLCGIRCLHHARHLSVTPHS